MATTRTQDSFAPDAAFRYVGGDPAVDFVNTADWTERGLERDRFTTYERVVEWAEGAGVLGGEAAARLRDVARRRPGAASKVSDAANQTRTVLRDLFVGVLNGAPGAEVVDRFNTLLMQAASRTQLAPGPEGGLVRTWAGLGEELESVLWPVVWSAAGIVSSSDALRLRMCAGQDCGWLYVDRSRNGLRRWCEMSVCGTAEKNRRRAGRA